MTQDATVNFTQPDLAERLDAEPLYYGLSFTGWLKIAIVSILMVATFRYNLLRLWLKTNPFNGEPNWRHAVCVPLIGIYFVFVHWDDLLATPSYTAWTGLIILILGILLFAYGIYPGQNDFIKDFGMVVALFGVVAMLCGWQVMKIAWFPIVFLVCAIPWPELVYSLVASPLQRLAARVAVATLRLCNVEAHNYGTKIIISARGSVWRTLNVAEACAGLRSLMTFISVAAAVAFLSVRPLWQKLIITFMAIPIAIFCNVMRVAGQGLLDHYFTQEISEGFAHQFVGIVMLIPGFFLILSVGWLLDVVFIEVVDDREDRRRRAALVKPTKVVEWKLPRTGLAAETASEAGMRAEPAPAVTTEAGGAPAATAMVATKAASRVAAAIPATVSVPASAAAKAPVRQTLVINQGLPARNPTLGAPSAKAIPTPPAIGSPRPRVATPATGIAPRPVTAAAPVSQGPSVAPRSSASVPGNAVASAATPAVTSAKVASPTTEAPPGAARPRPVATVPSAGAVPIPRPVTAAPAVPNAVPRIAAARQPAPSGVPSVPNAPTIRPGAATSPAARQPVTLKTAFPSVVPPSKAEDK